MSKHTPGPWHVHKEGGSVCTVLGPNNEDIIEFDNNGCASDPMPDYVALSDGNARLIAAAPELLEALEFVRPQLEGIDLDIAKAAIAKATD